MISADVKANKTTRNKDLVALSYKFLEVVCSKHEIQYKRGMYFLSDFDIVR